MMTTETESKLMISLGEASGRLGIPERTLRDLAVRGEFPARKLGRRWRVSVAALDAWLLKFNSGVTPIRGRA